MTTPRPAGLITGATSGIGRATAIALAQRGFDLALTGRNSERGRALAAGLTRRHPGQRFEFCPLDLSDLEAVRTASASWLGSWPRLDALVNNAGARMDRYEESAQGHELTFATNHLGHFLLTASLWPTLQAASIARVISVTSGARRGARPEIGWKPTADAYERRLAYANAKLANRLFAAELARRTAGGTIISVAFDPGVAVTRFALNNGLWPWLRHGLSHALRRQLTPVAVIGRQLADLAERAPASAHGRLYRGASEVTPDHDAWPPALAEALWHSSLEWCFPSPAPDAGTAAGPFTPAHHRPPTA